MEFGSSLSFVACIYYMHMALRMLHSILFVIVQTVTPTEGGRILSFAEHYVYRIWMFRNDLVDKFRLLLFPVW